jgi:SAM-dependent methyltransferase
MSTGADEFASLQRHTTRAREPFYDIAARYHDPSLPSLDIGAGRGDFAAHLKDRSIYLIEGNPASVARLKETYPNVFAVVLPGRLPFAEKFFHLIHSSHCIEHFEPAGLYEILSECDRCLADGGTLVISTPLLYDAFYEDLSHVKPYAPQVLVNYLCGPQGEVEYPRSRPVISTRYRVAELVYRYRITPLAPLNVGFQKPRLQRFLFKVAGFLARHNIGFYEKTGYTIALQKHAA